MATFEVRPARPEDRETVLAFCAHTWEWGDYIAEAWDGWLADQQGRLFVATSNGQAVGLLHLRMLNEYEAWLEGLRVDPAYRRQGVASALHQVALTEAMRLGARTVRLLTEMVNRAAIALARKSRMHEVGSFIPYQAPPLLELPRRLAALPRPEPARAEDLEEIIDYLNVSNIFPLTGGLYYSGFIAYSISDRLLKAKIEAGEVYLLRRWERLDGLMLTEQREGRHGKYLFIGYIDGTNADTIGQLAYVLRHLAAQRNLEMVRAHVPDLLMVRDTFAGAEYQAVDAPYITFERILS
ncbi:GNAT family N-acetyltransferase [Thermogemmatispora sp.]|uniref:GNAT family N-acetyltransferase n=1 Tax=Thermogemmatispora sp. TaxID=1968838 RepID=UPI001D9935FE|nr:GNAT family N-acetyltransferase [Thermogemmatispora sp.]MBX5450565.1 GNAT family N-acetyltransferase [Thermogemmatispora sp.]